MGSFVKGMTFTMNGNEYEVLAEGGSDPASCMVFALRAEKDTADPESLRAWKAEDLLARGEIVPTGMPPESAGAAGAQVPITDPLEQIAELKKRILAIEQRRLGLLKVDDPRGEVLLQDNVVRPNKEFNIWNYTRASGLEQAGRKIQYVKIRGLIIVISASNRKMEHFLFNISDQLQPCCRISGATLSSEGRVKIEISPRLLTIQGQRTQILSSAQLEGRIELFIEIGLDCQWATGVTSISARILQAAYLREVNGPGLRINKISFPEIGNHMLAIEGVCVDVYADDAGRP